MFSPWIIGQIRICWSSGFQNTPYMINLMKFWLRYLRLKTMDTLPNIDCSSTFYWLFRNQALSSTLILHQIQRSGQFWINSINWDIQGWRQSSTRWTFFRVKLVFEYEFGISLSLGRWDPRTLGPLDLGTFRPWDSWTSSLLWHLFILIHTSSYLLLSLPPILLLWYGLVIGGCELWHWRIRLEMDLWPIYWS